MRVSGHATTISPPTIATILGLSVAVLGAISLTGWVLDYEPLRHYLPFGLAMRANVAAGLLVCGLALAAHASPRSHGAHGRYVLGAIGFLIALLAALTLSQDLFGWNLGLDQFLARDETGTSRFGVPGRMSPPVAFCLLLFGTALLVAVAVREPHVRGPIQLAVAVTLILISAVALAGYAFEELLEIRFFSYSRISFYGATGFLLLGCGLLALLRAEGPLVWALDRGTTAGFAAGLAGMVLTAGISYQLTSYLRSDSEKVNRTLQSLREVQKLNSSLADFTISTGRYIVTRDERALAGRENTEAAIRLALGTLSGIVDTQAQQQRLTRIEALHARRLAMSEGIIASFRERIRAGNLPAADEPSPLGLEYPALGVEIERLVDAMEADEYSALELRQRLAKATSNRTFLLLPMGVFLSMTILLLGLFFLNDSAAARARAERRVARLSRVKEMNSSINSAVAHIRERQILLDEVCRIAVEKGGLHAAWVGWHDSAMQVIRPVSSAGFFDGFLDLVDLSTDVPSGEADSSAVRTVKSGKPQVTNDMVASSRLVYRSDALARGYLAMMHLPLVVGGATEGVLILYAAEAGFFDEEEVKLLEELAADVSFALDSLKKSERLEYLAFYDPLSELPNRSLFHDRLAQSLHSRGGEARLIAVVLLDLERFRRVNETLGRKTGDELLRRVGSRLRRASESAARIGVDMFGLVLRGARTAVEVNRSLESILDASFSEPFGLGGQELRVACRAGVAVYPDDGADADTLLRNAEAALRRGKSEGERVVFYAPEMNARAAEALAIETRLRRATSNREFVLHYQPKVNLESGLIVGMEALIRWQEPGKGLVPPGQFIPMLEETGLIVEVGRWAVEQTFADLRDWSKAGLKVPRVAVNVSAIQLQRKEFVDVMIEEIERGGDNPDWLELEITESLVMRNVEDSTRKLSILRGMGVTIAIDDFGTGYSSLAYLARLPVDKLKIDRSFISAVTNSGEATTLVTTMIALAHGLKLAVVAEGVETEEQARLLRLLRCDEAQGYFYSKPLPAVEIEKLLRAGGTLPAPA